MKKLLSIVLCTVLAVGVVSGCNKGRGNNPVAPTSSSSTSSASQEQSLVSNSSSSQKPSSSSVSNETISSVSSPSSSTQESSSSSQIESSSSSSKPSSSASSSSSQVATYTVNFNTDGGTNVASQTVTQGQKVTKPQDPTKTGWEFGGWFALGEDTQYNFDSVVNGGLTLKAKWNPIEISSTEQFLSINLAKEYNYILTQDLNFSGKEFVQLGSFKGVLDGNGKTISGINFTSGLNTGVFEEVAGTVKNLKVNANVNINVTSGTVYAGILASRVYGGKVVNCNTQGTISVTNADSRLSIYAGGISARNTDGVIENCMADVDITASNVLTVYAGGIVGYNGGEALVFAKVLGCVYNGTITATSTFDRGSSYVGGISAFNGGIVDKCVSYGGKLTANTDIYWAYAGGIVGDNNGGQVTNCLAINDVAVNTRQATTFRGAVCGHNALAQHVFDNNYAWDGQTVSYSVSDSAYNTLARHYFVQSKSVSASQISDSAWVQSVFGDTLKVQSGYLPYINETLKTQNTLVAAKGTFGNPIEISALSEITDYSKSYKLTKDINLSGNWTPIGSYDNPFFGSLDGNGFTISGVALNNINNGYNGFFGYFAGKVSNLTINASATFNNGSDGITRYLGGVVGYNAKGFIDNCTANVNFNGSGYGVLSGAIVGYNESGEVRLCKGSGTITVSVSTLSAGAGGICGINSQGKVYGSSSSVSVSITGGQGKAYAGGIVGKNADAGIVDGCFNSGSVTAKTNNASGSTAFAGGIAGNNLGSKILSCYSSGSVSGTSANILVVGLIVGENGSSKASAPTVSKCFATAVSGVSYGAGSSNVDIDFEVITSQDYATLAQRLGGAWVYDSVAGRPVIK